MTAEELSEIVEQEMNNPYVLGRLACNLKSRDAAVQRHHDAIMLDVFWRNTGNFWRCTVFLDGTTEDCLAQIDLHKDATVRVEAHEPCSLTIDPAEGILCLTRYKRRVG